MEDLNTKVLSGIMYSLISEATNNYHSKYQDDCENCKFDGTFISMFDPNLMMEYNISFMHPVTAFAMGALIMHKYYQAIMMEKKFNLKNGQ